MSEHKSICLVIIYNHNYEGNIEKLERIYTDRFKHIYHIIPFFSGQQKNVIPVYGNSYYFSSYVAQAYIVLRNIEVDSFLFIADDLILAPRLNEDNLYAELKLDFDSAFIPDLRSLSRDRVYWPHARRLIKWNQSPKGLELKGQFPLPEILKSKFEKMLGEDVSILPTDVMFPKPTRSEFHRKGRGFKKIFKWFLLTCIYLISRLYKKNRRLPYPFVRSYSDIFLIPRHTLSRFSHFCGLFAATELFAEIAIPTSLAIVHSKVKSESEIGKHGLAIWPHDLVNLGFSSKFNKSLTSLLNEFPEDLLYVHPIKLSEWD